MNELTLCDINPGQRAIIEKITSNSALKNRLLDFGFIKKTPVECVGISPLGDPKAFCVRGSVIALRSEDCSNIIIKVLN